MKKLLLSIFILVRLTWSSDLYLYNDKGLFNDDFALNILSKELKIDEKIFLKNKSLIYKGFLGSGNTTMILKVHDIETGNDLALRLPHGNEDKDYFISDGKRFINYTFEGFRELEESKLPIPKIHDYQKDSYLLVDLVEHDFDLKTFLARNAHFTEEQREKALKSLLQFAKETALYESIGDFHLQQVVYSLPHDKWTLLDWTSRHQLARLPSSPKIFSEFHFSQNDNVLDEDGKEIINADKTLKKRSITEYEHNVYDSLITTIEDQRRIQVEIDTLEIEEIKNQLQGISDHKEALKVYQDMTPKHLAGFYTLLQKDFIQNHITKFPIEKINASEVEQLLNGLGKFSPHYFSQFTEKILANIEDLDAFMILYKKINLIGVDEEMEDDLAMAIGRNIERILSNTEATPDNLLIINKLKGEFGVINYRTRDILGRADEILRPMQNCNRQVLSILHSTN